MVRNLIKLIDIIKRLPKEIKQYRFVNYHS